MVILFWCMKENKYKIGQLSEITGYPSRTIRYYVQEGLIEPPAGRGRGGFYYDSHLQTLYQIKSLQNEGLKLDTIRQMLQEPAEPCLQAAARAEEPEREVWVRCPIASGIELHIHRELEQAQRRNVAEIVRMARALLEHEEEEQSGQ